MVAFDIVYHLVKFHYDSHYGSIDIVSGVYSIVAPLSVSDAIRWVG